MASPTPGVTISPEGKKTFVPLENNPEVFADLIHRLGVSDQLQFYDVYDIDDPDELVYGYDIHALIVISPASVYHRVRAHDGSKILTYNASGPDEPVFWCKQTIGHACGLMALIHSISNGTAKDFITPDSLLDRLLKEALPLTPLPRAKVLYDSLELEQAHMASAYLGDSPAPSSAEPNGYHFLSFVRGTDGHLYELDGSWNGPIDRGLLEPDDHLLKEKALEMGVRRHVEAAYGNVEFSMVALATKPVVLPDSGWELETDPW